MLVRKLWIKYVVNIEVHFVGYLNIMDLINTRILERIKMAEIPVQFVQPLV